jgi:hypothetical protein
LDLYITGLKNYLHQQNGTNDELRKKSTHIMIVFTNYSLVIPILKTSNKNWTIANADLDLKKKIEYQDANLMHANNFGEIKPNKYRYE